MITSRDSIFIRAKTHPEEFRTAKFTMYTPGIVWIHSTNGSFFADLANCDDRCVHFLPKMDSYEIKRVVVDPWDNTAYFINDTNTVGCIQYDWHGCKIGLYGKLFQPDEPLVDIMVYTVCSIPYIIGSSASQMAVVNSTTGVGNAYTVGGTKFLRIPDTYESPDEGFFAYNKEYLHYWEIHNKDNRWRYPIGKESPIQNVKLRPGLEQEVYGGPRIYDTTYYTHSVLLDVRRENGTTETYEFYRCRLRHYSGHRSAAN